MNSKDRLAHFSRECIEMRRAIQDGHLSATDDILIAKAHLMSLMNDLMTMLAHTPRKKGGKATGKTGKS